MSRARAILERMRHAPLWSGGARGIYANYSKYPEVEFYAKCPGCGALHGSYKSLKQAHEKKLCPVCSMEDVDKIKDWIKDAVHPEKPKPGKKPQKFPSVAKVLGIKEDDEEGIQAAAVRAHDGTVYTALAHFGAVQQLLRDGKTYSDEDLGFVTTRGRFVTRDEAELIAMRQGQLKPDIDDPSMVHASDFDHYLPPDLSPEDLIAATPQAEQHPPCECEDPGCPVCGGKCENPGTVKLWRTDMGEGGEPLLFCDKCAEDAFESGVFSGEPPEEEEDW